MLNVDESFLLLAIISDQHMKRVTMWNPTDQSTIGTERNDGVTLDRQVPSESVGIVEQQCIGESKELHDSFILSKIFMSLQQEHVVFTVGASNAQFSRSLFRCYDLE